MSPRDTAHAFDLDHACRHLYRRSEGCPVCTPVVAAANGTSWDSRQHAPVARPWWRGDDGELSWPAVLLVLAVAGAAVLAALVVGQQRQCQRLTDIASPAAARYCPPADSQETAQ